jgi:two-component system OmpR family sensor kinase
MTDPACRIASWKISSSHFSVGDAQNTAGGYGLGLAIAQRVIAAVNGKIQAKNKLGGGLLVEIDLPV